ncbi:hypothetical protein RUM43_002482 [Polyplax serrata]|uniref:Protein kinase domain-containing protein n=1 Tax=Polyplax serrata TaxID=468196 RepID=A0AAN8PDY5_POLSC
MTPIKIPEGSAPEDSKMVEFPRHRLRVLEKLGEGGFGMVSDQKKNTFPPLQFEFSLPEDADESELIIEENCDGPHEAAAEAAASTATTAETFVLQLGDLERNQIKSRRSEVHLCEAEGILDFNGVSTSHKKQLVVIKSLWRGASENTKKDFLRESSWLASLKDPNLCRIVGVCSLEEPLYVLQEYSELGELPQFLRLQNLSEGDENGVSYGCLIYIATQIASGMKYLESLELIHRDLSARNCLIGKQYCVKVSDHAIYCSRYSNDYYLADTKARLPVRWMAWESLLLGKHTSKSDVWSFAVTLWEILMCCSQQPFAELTNEQVVENSNHLYQNDGLARYLPRPPPCPREIYDLMGECWKRQAADRPLFSEIHLFLQRKNLGYMPCTG